MDQSLPFGQNYFDAIKSSEGFNAHPFWDNKQWTWGHGTKAPGPTGTITPQQADTDYASEITPAANFVDKFNPGMPDGARAALSSLTYNAGTQWSKDHLGAAVKAGDWDTAVPLFKSYNRADGAFSPGLADRRNRESQWFPGQSSSPPSTSPTATPGGTVPQPQFMDPATRDYYTNLAHNLTTQGISTAPVGSWTQGLARVLDAGVGAAWGDRLTADAQARQTDASKQFGDYINAPSGMAGGVQHIGPASPPQPMTAPIAPVQKSDIGAVGTEEAPVGAQFPGMASGPPKAIGDNSNYAPLPDTVQSTLPNGGLASGPPSRTSAIAGMFANPETRTFAEGEAAKEVAAQRAAPLNQARAQFYTSRAQDYANRQAKASAAASASAHQFDGAGLDEDGKFVPSTPATTPQPSKLGGPTDDDTTNYDPSGDQSGVDDTTFQKDVDTANQDDKSDAASLNIQPRTDAGFINGGGTQVADDDSSADGAAMWREAGKDHDAMSHAYAQDGGDFGLARTPQPVASPSERPALRANPAVVQGATAEQQQRLKNEIAHRATLTQLYGDVPKGFRWDDDGTLIDLKDQSKKEIAAARASPMLQDIQIAKDVLIGGDTTMAGRALSKAPIIGNYLLPANREAIDNLNHSIATLTALVEGNRHANAQDKRFLQYFSISKDDTQETLGNKLNQLSRIYNTYVGNAKEAQAGAMYQSAALKRANQVRTQENVQRKQQGLPLLPMIGVSGNNPNEAARVKGLSNDDLLKELQQ